MGTFLAIDTSSAYLSLALQARGKIFTYLDKVDNKQSENIIPQIKQLLLKAGVLVGEIDYIVYNQGPGSFTGLRIGLSIALGITFGIKALLIPIPAFYIYALQASELSTDSKVVVGLDARLNQLYLAGIDISTLEYFIQPELVNPGDIIIGPDKAVAIGSGFMLYKELMPKAFNRLSLLNPEHPDAGYLLKLANLGKFPPVAAAKADLLYLRNKVALDLDEQKHKIIHPR